MLRQQAKPIKKRKWLRRLGFVLGFFGVLIFAFLIWFYFATRVHPPECKPTAITQSKRVSLAANRWQHGNCVLQKGPYGLYEMYLEGNPYEIGYTHGSLTRELNAFQEQSFVNQIKILIPSMAVLNKLKYFIGFFNRNLEDHITDEYKREIYGVSQFASDSFDFIAGKYQRILNYHAAHDIGHAVQDKNLATGCTSFIIKGKKTADGDMLLGRNFDFFAGDSFAKNKIICFVKPDKGYKYAFVTWAGFTGVVSGMNEKGLAITINASKSSIPSASATPISILIKEILQYASNINEAKAIAKKRQTFVSESILIASATDKTGIIIEKSPDKTGYYAMTGDQLICPNHYQSAAFKNDEINLQNIKESSSNYRLQRMGELLGQRDSLTPLMAAGVLRDHQGKGNTNIGLGNEKCINQLICHHAVVMDPTKLMLYVSTGPFNLGTFVGYDLNAVFNSGLKTPVTHYNLVEDSFKYSKEFNNFMQFRTLRNELQKQQTFDEKLLQKFINLNPLYFLTWMDAGNYCQRLGKPQKAITYYKQALKLEIATVKEKKEIEAQIIKCKKQLQP